MKKYHKPCPYCPTEIRLVARSCRKCRWRFSPRLICPDCKTRKDVRAERCRSCASLMQVSASTKAIIAELQKRGRSRGVFQEVAKMFGKTPSRISAIAKTHDVFQQQSEVNAAQVSAGSETADAAA